jgi:hypothetical protein
VFVRSIEAFCPCKPANDASTLSQAPFRHPDSPFPSTPSLGAAFATPCPRPRDGGSILPLPITPSGPSRRSGPAESSSSSSNEVQVSLTSTSPCGGHVDPPSSSPPLPPPPVGRGCYPGGNGLSTLPPASVAPLSTLSSLYLPIDKGGLTDAEFERAIESVFCEDGFSDFVHRVQRCWQAKMLLN